MEQVLISLGSNVQPQRNLPVALSELDARPEIELIAVSDFFETPAVGNDGTYSDQEAFLNAAAHVETALDAAELRGVLRTIEEKMGRVRTADKFAARPIDLDIALYGNAVLDLEGNQIPDPDILCFPHVAVPLANVAPAWIHPGTGDTLSQIANRLDSTEMEKIVL